MWCGKFRFHIKFTRGSSRILGYGLNWEVLIRADAVCQGIMMLKNIRVLFFFGQSNQ